MTDKRLNIELLIENIGKIADILDKHHIIQMNLARRIEVLERKVKK